MLVVDFCGVLPGVVMLVSWWLWVLWPKLNKPEVELLCCGCWLVVPPNRLLVCFADVSCGVLERLPNKVEVAPLVFAALNKLLLGFGVSSALSFACWLKLKRFVFGVSLVLLCVNMPVLIVLALEDSKPVKTLPPGVVGRSSGCGLDAPNGPLDAPFCCGLLNSDVVLVFGVSSGLLTPLV